jgi:hypothetical protein
LLWKGRPESAHNRFGGSSLAFGTCSGSLNRFPGAYTFFCLVANPRHFGVMGHSQIESIVASN